jgi:multidrug efflux system outer membrane protein
MKAKHIYCLFFITLILLSGCMVGKKYSKPEAPTGITYRDTVVTDTSSLQKWFDLYQDTAITNHYYNSLDSNRDLLLLQPELKKPVCNLPSSRQTCIRN